MLKIVWYLWLWIKEVFVGITRNLRRTTSVIMIATISLLLTSGIHIVASNLVFLADEMGNKLEIEMHLKDEVPESKHALIQDRLEKIKEIHSVEYIDKEQAKEIASTFVDAESMEIINTLPENPLPVSYVISLKNPNDIHKVAEELKTWDEQEKVKIGKHASDLLAASETLKKVGYIATLVIAISTILTIRNAIKNNVIDRSNEIETKKLIGASMMTIRVPFILEAIVVTMIASLFTYGIIYYGYEQIVALVRGTLPFFPMLEANSVMNNITSYLFGFALIVGFVGSFTSVRKHVKKY